MGDVKDWGAFLRGRWNWSKSGYEQGFPRRCEFTDVDATVEFDGRRLVIETKHHDGGDYMDYPDMGQLLSLREEAKSGRTVFVLYGCGACDSPQGLRIIGATKADDQWLDWRGQALDQRRYNLKAWIDWAMGIRTEQPAA
jgi:hypothetical protein